MFHGVPPVPCEKVERFGTLCSGTIRFLPPRWSRFVTHGQNHDGFVILEKQLHSGVTNPGNMKFRITKPH